MSKALLVFGATGKQGGALIKALLAANADFQILAVTRNTQSVSAQKLAQQSPKIKLINGDLDNPEQVFKKAKEISSAAVWGVFSVQVGPHSFLYKRGLVMLTIYQFIMNQRLAEQQGKSLIDASLANEVKHFVYSSVDRGGDSSSTNPTNVPHFISKHNIEQHLFSMAENNPSMTYTVLRPVAFMDNLSSDFLGKVFSTAYRTTLKGKPLQLIATSDIGFFAAQAFLHPQQYAGKSISLAGDDLTYSQFRNIFKEKTGSELPTTYGFVASIILWLVKDLGLMYKWFHDQGYGANIAELKQIKPDLKDFATWLETESQFARRR